MEISMVSVSIEFSTKLTRWVDSEPRILITQKLKSPTCFDHLGRKLGIDKCQLIETQIAIMIVKQGAFARFGKSLRDYLDHVGWEKKTGTMLLASFAGRIGGRFACTSSAILPFSRMWLICEHFFKMSTFARTMKKYSSQNYEHYIHEGWSEQPKERFKRALDIVKRNNAPSNCHILDVGCATGEFLGYARKELPQSSLYGVDCDASLLKFAGKMLPDAEFRNASATALPGDYLNKFDVVTSIGCISIFDEDEVDLYLKNVVDACKPGGLMVILGPLNEYGVDVMIRHRTREPGKVPAWETGWNIHSIETIRDVVTKLGYSVETIPFRIDFPIAPDQNPVRTWTSRFGARDFQLTNGLKLLIDHYFVVIRK